MVEGVDRDDLHEDVPDVLIVGVGRNQLTDCRFGESRFRLRIEGCDFFVDCASGSPTLSIPTSTRQRKLECRFVSSNNPPPSPVALLNFLFSYCQ
jgi:hypothetical protein